MDTYIDGFLLPIAQEKLGAYRDLADLACKVWKEHGALEYVECVGDDLDAKGMVSFRQSAGVKEGEVVILAWIVYRSKEERDRINAAVMADPRLKDVMPPESMPFDCARMAYGGFRTLVSAWQTTPG